MCSLDFSGFSNTALSTPSTNSVTPSSGARNSVRIINTMLTFTEVACVPYNFSSIPSVFTSSSLALSLLLLSLLMLFSSLANHFSCLVCLTFIMGLARLNHLSCSSSSLFSANSFWHSYCNLWCSVFLIPLGHHCGAGFLPTFTTALPLLPSEFLPPEILATLFGLSGC
jgi:hypothetical protein